jgi:hypothetical protein
VTATSVAAKKAREPSWCELPSGQLMSKPLSMLEAWLTTRAQTALRPRQANAPAGGKPELGEL